MVHWVREFELADAGLELGFKCRRNKVPGVCPCASSPSSAAFSRDERLCEPAPPHPVHHYAYIRGCAHVARSHTGSHLALTLSCLIAVPVCASCAGEGKRSDSDTVRAASGQLPAGPSGSEVRGDSCMWCIGADCVPMRVPVPVRSGEC